MLFNSVEFCVFLPVVFVLYWYVFRWSVMARNMVLFGASMFFYAWWDWRFLGLVFYSAGIDYVVALWLERTDSPRKRKLLLLISLVTNLGLLGFFKYFNFFITSLDGAFTFFGHPLDMHTLRIVLPVGISFYTFQSLSYTIDVYRRQLNACHQPLIYFPFVLFFPQLMAGPIERAHHLMPQFKAPKLLDPKMVASGLRLAAWGMFKKVVIADRIAAGVNAVYDTPTQHSGLTLLLATVLFAIQIYCDFSGYSDIAVGAARLFGFDLMKNFRSPYNSRSIAEFWKRWHISLSSWFRDYLYISMGGNRVAKPLWYRNLFITFLVSGLWHGANWTFVIWGALHGTYLVFATITENIRGKLGSAIGLARLPWLNEAWQRAVTFGLVCFAWIFFRANNLGDAMYVAGHLGFSPKALFDPAAWGAAISATGLGKSDLLVAIFSIAAMELVHGLEQRSTITSFLADRPVLMRWSIYSTILIALVFFGAYYTSSQFIYFQF